MTTPQQTHTNDHRTERRPMTTPQQTHTPIGLIVLAWALVAIPLLYGLIQTVRAASTLFTG